MAEILDRMVFPFQMNFFSWGRRVYSPEESVSLISLEKSELKPDWILRPNEHNVDGAGLKGYELV
jgi:hypothetical protein